MVFQAAENKNGGDVYDLLLFGVSSGGGVSGSLSYVVPVLLLAGDCPGLGTYLVDVSEVCGNGCGISAVVGDTGSLEGLDAPGGYTLLDSWKNSGGDKDKVLLVTANNHYYLTLRPKAIEENAAVTVVLRHPTTRGITSTPVRITLTPNAITPGLLHDALTEALKEDSPQSAQQAFEKNLLQALTQNYNARVHPVIVPPNAGDREAKDLVESALLSCGGDNNIPVRILDRYNTLEDTLRLLVTEFDLGQKPFEEQHFALCVDKDTKEALGLENTCYGKYIDTRITDEVLGTHTLNTFGVACTAGLFACEMASKMFVGGLAAVLEAGATCWLPPYLAKATVEDKMRESLADTGSVGLYSYTVPWMGLEQTAATFVGSLAYGGTVLATSRSVAQRYLADRAVQQYLASQGKISRLSPFISRWQYERVIAEQFRALFPDAPVRDALEQAKILSKPADRVSALAKICHISPTYCSTKWSTLVADVLDSGDDVFVDKYALHYYQALRERVLTEEALKKIGAESERIYRSFLKMTGEALREPEKYLSDEGIRLVREETAKSLKQLGSVELSRSLCTGVGATGTTCNRDLSSFITELKEYVAKDPDVLEKDPVAIIEEVAKSDKRYSKLLQTYPDLKTLLANKITSAKEAGYSKITDILLKAQRGEELSEEELRLFNKSFRDSYTRFKNIKQVLTREIEKLKTTLGEKLPKPDKFMEKLDELKERKQGTVTPTDVEEEARKTITESAEEAKSVVDEAAKEADEAAKLLKEGKALTKVERLKEFGKDVFKTFPCVVAGYLTGTLAAYHTVGTPAVQTLTLTLGENASYIRIGNLTIGKEGG
ncbi:MAG: hypothetical protein GSR81_01530 [Desulfurococcales archaeon]|nr:hypothetical protein [Desulfurococcales archaeon]